MSKVEMRNNFFSLDAKIDFSEEQDNLAEEEHELSEEENCFDFIEDARKTFHVVIYGIVDIYSHSCVGRSLGKPQKSTFLSGPATKPFSPPPPA